MQQLRDWAVLFQLGAMGVCATAGADIPPSPPCAPGFVQLDARTCREAIQCPPGWKVDAGPVCVPWECQKATDCSWKGMIPCREADVCAPAGGGRAVRVCDSNAGDRACPAGLSCQKRKLCASFSTATAAQTEAFGNWTPDPAAASPAPSAALVRPSTPSTPAAAQRPAPAPASAPTATPSAGDGKNGCSVLASRPAPSATGTLMLAWAALLLATQRLRRRSAQHR